MAQYVGSGWSNYCPLNYLNSVISLRRVFAAAIAGAVAALSFAWPVRGFVSDYGAALWCLHFLASMAYVVALRNGGGRCGAAVGYAFHFTLLVVSLSWLEISMAEYGGLPSPLAWLAVFALAGFLAFYGTFGAIAFRLLMRRGAGAFESSVLFAAIWLLTELARGQWFSGFGWASAGYAYIDSPWAGAAAWVGVYGLGAIAMFMASVVAEAVIRKTLWGPLLSVAIGSTAFAALATTDMTQQASDQAAVLLQGNIPQEEKFEAHSGVARALEWYGERLRRIQAPLVMAPETAIPILPQQLPTTFWEQWPDPAVASTIRLVGIPLGNAADGYTNSVIGFTTPQSPLDYRYDKHHLVPFGEFIPPLFKWFVRMMQIPLGDFSRGAINQPSIHVGQERVAPAICFEDLFPEELARRFLDEGNSPTILANFSNLAWFADSTAMYQHLHISRMRSLEFGRPSLRVSNTGITAAVTHRGLISASLPPMTPGVLRVSVQARTGITPFAWWSARWGMLPLWALAVAILVFAYSLKRARV